MSKPLALEVVGGTYAPEVVRHLGQARELRGLIGSVVPIRPEYRVDAEGKSRTEGSASLNVTEQLAMAGRGLMAYTIKARDRGPVIGVAMVSLGGKIKGDDRQPAVYMQSWFKDRHGLTPDQITGLGADMFERHKNASDVLPYGIKTVLVVNESDVLATGIRSYLKQREEAVGIELDPQPTTGSALDYPLSHKNTANPTSYFVGAAPQGDVLVIPYTNLIEKDEEDK